MLRLLAALLIALLPVPVMAQAVPDKVAQSVAEIDRIFADFQRGSHAPGLVYGIVADGRLVHVKAFGVQDLKARLSGVTGRRAFRS